MTLNVIFDLFCCRRENPEIKGLIKKFPRIDVQKIVAPYLRKNLDEESVQTLKTRVTSEAQLRDELGEERYKELLAESSKSSLCEFTLDSSFYRMGDRFAIDLRQVNLSEKEKILLLNRRINQASFEDRAVARWGVYPADVKEVIQKAFPRFEKGYLPIRPDDWHQIQTVIQEQAKCSAAPQDILVFDRYLQRYNIVDRLERKKALAMNRGDFKEIPELNEEIEKRKILPKYKERLGNGQRMEPAAQSHLYHVRSIGDILEDDGKFEIHDLARGKVFREKLQEVIKKQEQLDFDEGVRLVRNGLFDPWKEDYKRVVLPLSSDRGLKRTAIVDQLEAAHFVRQLKDKIVQGRSDQFSWNDLLRFNDYMSAVNLSGLHKMKDFQPTLMQFNEFSNELEELIKDRAVLELLDKEVIFPTYDLTAGVKQVAEIRSVFGNWVQSIHKMLSEIEKSPVLKKDFQWFEFEYRRILPRFEEFFATFPPDLEKIHSLRPDEIRSQYTPQKIEDIISRTLDCLSSSFYKLFPTYLYQLQIAQRGKTFESATKKLNERHKKNTAFLQAKQVALPNAFQVPNRVELCMMGLAKAVSELSPLQVKILSTFEVVKKKTLENEMLRVREMRNLVQTMDKKTALKQYYPTL